MTTDSHNAAPSVATPDIVLADTVNWLEKAVIGLNLCPFAKGVHIKGQIHYVVSEATDAEGVAHDFLDFNDFLELADNMVDELDLGGILQVASFHPLFQFEGTDVDDVTNCTNRSPYPTLHLLREDSIDKAVEAFPEAESIYEKNMDTLEQLGLEGWLDLGVGARCPFPHKDDAADKKAE